MNIQSAIIEGTNILKSKYIQTAQLDTEILMAKALGKDRKYIVLNNNKFLKDKNLKIFEKLINERASRKPIAYLINKKFFWNFEFFVTSDTLIPRPDTELIIEQILRRVGSEDVYADVKMVNRAMAVRKYLYRQAWLFNIIWFVGYFILMFTVGRQQPAAMPDMIWQG